MACVNFRQAEPKSPADEVITIPEDKEVEMDRYAASKAFLETLIFCLIVICSILIEFFGILLFLKWSSRESRASSACNALTPKEIRLRNIDCTTFVWEVLTMHGNELQQFMGQGIPLSFTIYVAHLT